MHTAFPWWLVMLTTFHVSVDDLYIFFGKIQVLCPLFNWLIFFFFLLLSHKSLYIVDINTFLDIWFANIFLIQ